MDPDRASAQLVDLGVAEVETAYHYLVPDGRRGPGTLQRVTTTVLDWTIDGAPLRQHLTDEGDEGRGFERVTMLGDAPDQALEQIDRLLGRDWPDGDDGRTALLVCAECGSLDCGAVTALVVFSRDTVEWRDIRFEYPRCHGHPPESEIPPVTFAFDRHRYTALLLGLRALDAG
ncbi:hypothetical protein [Nakamurella sp.]|uniref:hypothetical protein n=1 Tax=Nakamurella sp. TaxID=1869182 RepID=UPI003B3B1839